MQKCDGNHGGPPCLDPECWALEDSPGLLTETVPLHLSLMPDEADYLARLVSADQQRMVEARDHGISHGMRGYLPPDLQHAERISHSLSMARTAAAIEAIEAIEDRRQDITAGQ